MEFRTLIIDDDEQMMLRLEERLRGMKAVAGRRTVVPQVDTVLVGVEQHEGAYRFTEQTLLSLANVSANKYDYVILDYAYASPERQPIQWNEGTNTPKKHKSNDHLLTIVQLHAQLLQSPHASTGAGRKKVEKFFASPTRLMLRSFQHDRKNDILGPYSARAEATQGIFTGNTGIDRLDGFSLIYGSEPELREHLYHQPTDGMGRRLYRNAATAIMLGFYQSALEHHLARKANRLIVVKGAASVSLFVALIAALSAVLQSLAPELMTALKDADWSTVAWLAAAAITFLFFGSFGIAWITERGVRRLIYDHSDD